MELFTKHKIFTATEMHSRYEILLENYCKTSAHRSPDHGGDGEQTDSARECLPYQQRSAANRPCDKHNRSAGI